MFRENLTLLVERPKRMAIWVGILGIAPFLFRWAAFILMMLVTLRKGAKDGFLLALLLSVIAWIELTFFAHVPFSNMMLVLFTPLLFWGRACVLRYTASWANVFQATMALGVAGVLALFQWAPKFVSALHAQALQQEQLAKNVFASWLGAQDAQQLPDFASQFDVALVVLVFLFVMLGTLVVARYLQASLYNPGGFKRECYEWRLSGATACVLLGLMVIALLWHTATALNVVPILMLGPICVGLSLMHWYTARFKYQTIILFVCYVLLVVTYLAVALALIGWLDSFIHFRKRFKEVNL